ncbi:glycosyl transferase family 90-domain-containing protein [Aspergillus coremiiformis]|uniref:Glycosyl transferase family 90-domain-containing protein n=1 Tax=Aspergillus coremiiformis TaxID=138285 RepID=A0A5N6ZGK4_9EURO|nr:glycosyl transferase family 90-domain-containing protein [Aspergillus coremiiformis]
MQLTRAVGAQLRYLAIEALVLFGLMLFFFWKARSVQGNGLEFSSNIGTNPSPQPLSQSTDTYDEDTWDFMPERDANNHGLSEKHCRLAFPKLFIEVDKSAGLAKQHPITLRDLDDIPIENGIVRGIIYHGELYVVEFGPMPYTFTRGKATLQALNRALISFTGRENLPDIEFVFTTHDFSTVEKPIWSYAKRDEENAVWLMPDFGYWSWPEVKIGPYQEIRRRIMAIDDGSDPSPGLLFQDKKKQLFWRGTVATNPELRGQLLQATEGKSWADTRALDWGNEEDIRSNLLSMEDHCRYMFLAHVEGHSFSGAGKYLLNCRSVFVSHKLVWREAHHHIFIASGPDANYIEVERDFSDLNDKIEYFISNPEAAEQIANNTVAMFRDRYLTPAAESCYWRHLIRQYASGCAFEPLLYSTQADGKKQPRGVPFESWILTSP